MISIKIVFLIGFIIIGFIYAPMLFDCYNERFFVDFDGLCLTIALTVIGVAIVGVIFILSVGVIQGVVKYL